MDVNLTFDGHRVRMVGTAERPEWVAKDACHVLGIHNSRDTLAKCLPPEEKGVASIYTLGGPQEYATVTEAGLYRLISRSRKPTAQRFQAWLFGEVLPAIRQHGCYPPPASPVAVAVVDLRDPRQLAALTLQLTQIVAEREEQIATLAPKAEGYERLQDARGSVCLQDAARALGRHPNVFIAQLVADGVLWRTGKELRPEAEALSSGYFRVRTLAIGGDDFGPDRVRVQTMVTARGLQWLAKRYPAEPAPTAAPLRIRAAKPAPLELS